MRDFRFPNDAPLLSQRPQKAIDGLSGSLISLCLDLLAKLQAIHTSLLPSREHILSIRVEDAPALAAPLCFREVSLLDPSLERSPAQPHTTSNLRETETLGVEGHHLLIAVIALLATTETGSFIIEFWRRLPVFHGNHFSTL